jgi:protein SCO1
MNAAVMPRTRFAAILLALALPACAEPPPPLQGAAIGGPFELSDKDGQKVRWDDFGGKWRMVYFGYTWCPDVCPFDVQRMMQGFDLWAAENPELADQVQPIFISIDPERDTPAKVGEYTANFSPRLLGLTGTPDQVAVAVSAFAAFAQKGEVQPDGNYLMDHTNAAYLMGRAGNPVALVPVDQSKEAVAAELAKWVD